MSSRTSLSINKPPIPYFKIGGALIVGIALLAIGAHSFRLQQLDSVHKLTQLKKGAIAMIAVGSLMTLGSIYLIFKYILTPNKSSHQDHAEELRQKRLAALTARSRVITADPQPLGTPAPAPTPKAAAAKHDPFLRLSPEERRAKEQRLAQLEQLVAKSRLTIPDPQPLVTPVPAPAPKAAMATPTLSEEARTKNLAALEARVKSDVVAPSQPEAVPSQPKPQKNQKSATQNIEERARLERLRKFDPKNYVAPVQTPQQVEEKDDGFDSDLEGSNYSNDNGMEDFGDLNDSDLEDDIPPSIERRSSSPILTPTRNSSDPDLIVRNVTVRIENSFHTFEYVPALTTVAELKASIWERLQFSENAQDYNVDVTFTQTKRGQHAQKQRYPNDQALLAYPHGKEVSATPVAFTARVINTKKPKKIVTAQANEEEGVRAALADQHGVSLYGQNHGPQRRHHADADLERALLLSSGIESLENNNNQVMETLTYTINNQVYDFLYTRFTTVKELKEGILSQIPLHERHFFQIDIEYDELGAGDNGEEIVAFTAQTYESDESLLIAPTPETRGRPKVMIRDIRV